MCRRDRTPNLNSQLGPPEAAFEETLTRSLPSWCQYSPPPTPTLSAFLLNLEKQHLPWIPSWRRSLSVSESSSLWGAHLTAGAGAQEPGGEGFPVRGLTCGNLSACPSLPTPTRPRPRPDPGRVVCDPAWVPGARVVAAPRGLREEPRLPRLLSSHSLRRRFPGLAPRPAPEPGGEARRGPGDEMERGPPGGSTKQVLSAPGWGPQAARREAPFSDSRVARPTSTCSG